MGHLCGRSCWPRRIVGEPSHLDAMDITVRRNAYGRQIDSFSAMASLPEVADHPLPLTFIRAPWIEEAGPDVQVLHTLKGRITAAGRDGC